MTMKASFHPASNYKDYLWELKVNHLGCHEEY